MVMNRYTYEFKLFLMNEIIQEKRTICSVAKEHDVQYGTLADWFRRYNIHGEEALRPWSKRYDYPEATRVAAVEDVVYNGVSKHRVIRKYNISSLNVLLGWIDKYNKGEKLKRKGRSPMPKKSLARKTTLEERLDIVQYTLDNDNNYLAAVKKYDVSYQQVYNWVRKYEKFGMNGIQDKRGKNQPIEELSELDQLRIENRKLRERNQCLEMEQDFTKKLQELRQRYKTFL